MSTKAGKLDGENKFRATKKVDASFDEGTTSAHPEFAGKLLKDRVDEIRMMIRKTTNDKHAVRDAIQAVRETENYSRYIVVKIIKTIQAALALCKKNGKPYHFWNTERDYPNRVQTFISRLPKEYQDVVNQRITDFNRDLLKRKEYEKMSPRELLKEAFGITASEPDFLKAEITPFTTHLFLGDQDINRAYVAAHEKTGDISLEEMKARHPESTKKGEPTGGLSIQHEPMGNVTTGRHINKTVNGKRVPDPYEGTKIHEEQHAKYQYIAPQVPDKKVIQGIREVIEQIAEGTNREEVVKLIRKTLREDANKALTRVKDEVLAYTKDGTPRHLIMDKLTKLTGSHYDYIEDDILCLEHIIKWISDGNALRLTAADSIALKVAFIETIRKYSKEYRSIVRRMIYLAEEIDLDLLAVTPVKDWWKLEPNRNLIREDFMIID